MMRILSSDLLIADVIVPLAGNAALAALVQKYHLQPGGKISLDRAQFEEFSAALIGTPVTIVPGGSSANMLVTLRKLLGDAVSVDFIGVAGEGLSSLMIRSSLEEAGIKLHPSEPPAHIPAKTAMSYVIVLPDGQRTIATYPGNAGELLAPGMVTDALLSGCDAVHVLGSLWAKIGPAFADALVAGCLAYKKQFWLSLPTHGVSRSGMPDMISLIKKADLLLGNEEELTRILGDGALQKLQTLYIKNAEDFSPRLRGESEGGDVTTTDHPHLTSPASGGGTQVAFITCGEKGAAVITAAGIESIAPVTIPAAEIKNTLGAGDTAFAGFVAGHVCGLPDAVSAKIAVTLAGEKLRVNAARLNDPKAALPEILMDMLVPAKAGTL